MTVWCLFRRLGTSILVVGAVVAHASLVPLALAAAVPTERAILVHPGYIITIWRTGVVRVDFVLNQQRVPPDTIARGFGNYPRETVRLGRLDRRMTNALFGLLESPEFLKVGPEYLAAPGTFAYAGHRVIMTLAVYRGTAKARTITFDSSRRPDWPQALRRAADQMFRLAEQTGPLPVGPFIE